MDVHQNLRADTLRNPNCTDTRPTMGLSLGVR
jgi:hypothetical protein